jgi:alpha-1,6-mannosyltransferase
MAVTSLHVTNAWHAQSGGIRTFYRALLDSAGAAGRRVVLVVPGKRTAIEDHGAHGRVYTVAAPRAPAFDRRYRILYPHHFLPGVGRTLARIVGEERPDVLEICDKYSLPYFAGLLRKGLVRGLARPPLLVGLSCERFDDNLAAYVAGGVVSRAFTRWYIRHIYGPGFDVHLANSVYTADELRTALHDRAPGFVELCPTGVDASSFGPAHRSVALRAELHTRLGLGPDGRLLLYAGRLSPEKGLPLLLQSVSRLMEGQGGSGLGLVIAGNGPLLPSLMKSLPSPLRGRTVFTGHLSREALAAHYASVDVFVHPNSREPFGIAPLEAMASGIPVVLPAAGGVLTYATADNAWLAPPEPGAFAAAIEAALEGNPARLEAARRTAERFAWPIVVAEYFALQDRLLASPPSLARQPQMSPAVARRRSTSRA